MVLPIQENVEEAVHPVQKNALEKIPRIHESGESQNAEVTRTSSATGMRTKTPGKAAKTAHRQSATGSDGTRAERGQSHARGAARRWTPETRTGTEWRGRTRRTGTESPGGERRAHPGDADNNLQNQNLTDMNAEIS